MHGSLAIVRKHRELNLHSPPRRIKEPITVIVGWRIKLANAYNGLIET